MKCLPTYKGVRYATDQEVREAIARDVFSRFKEIAKEIPGTEEYKAEFSTFVDVEANKPVQQSSQPVDTETTKVVSNDKEFDLADSLTPIEQNFTDGQGGRKMQSKFKDKSTMDLIISGDRTRTTRAKTDIQRMAKDYGLSKISDLVGKVIRMTDKTGKQVYTRITNVASFTQEYQDATWQKEGWVKSVTDRLIGNYPYAIEFEVVNKSTQPTIPAAPIVDEEIDDSDIPEGDVDDFNDAYKKVKLDTFEKYATVDTENALEHLKALLPDAIAYELVDDYVKVFSNGDVATGMFKNSMVTVSRFAGPAIPYHEGFHVVFRTLLTPEQQEALIAEVKPITVAPSKETINAIMKEKKVNRERAIFLFYEEILADDFGNWMVNPKSVEFTKRESGIKAFFERLLKWIKNVFNNTYTTEQLFNKIKKGDFKNKPIKTERDVAFSRHPLFTQTDIEAIVKQLAYPLLKNITNVDSISKIDFGKIRKIVLGGHTDAKNKGNKEAQARFGNVYRNLGFFEKEVRDYIRGFGVLDEDALNEEDDAGNLVPIDTLTISDLDKSTAAIRLIVALTPKYKDYANKIYDTEDSYLGLPMFSNLVETWNFIKSSLVDVTEFSKEGDIDIFTVMIEKLTEASKYKPEIQSVIERVKNSSIQVQTQFVMAMSGAVENYSTTLISGEVGTDDFRVRIADGDVQARDKTVRLEWNEELIDLLANVNEDSVLSYDLAAVQNVHTLYNDFIDTLNNGIKKKTSIDATKKSFIKLLASIGVEIDDRTLSYAIDQEKGRSENIKFKSLFLNKEFGLSNGFLNLFKSVGLPVFFNKGKYQSMIMDQKGFLRLADYAALFRDDLAENSILGPGGNTYSSYTNFTARKKRFLEYKNNPEALKAILNTPYGQGSIWGNWLLEDGNFDKFRILTLNNYKVENVGDVGEKMSELVENDTFINTVNRTLKGNFIGLAEADKETQYTVVGPPIERSELRGDPLNMYLEKETAIDILMHYLASELNRMRAAYTQLYGDKKEKIKPLPLTEQILHYHYKNEPGDNNANALNNYLFPSMDLKKLKLVTTKGSPIILTDDNFYLNGNVREAVKSIFMDLVRNDIEILADNGVIRKEDDETLVNVAISSELLSEYSTAEVLQAIGDYTLNSIIGNVEDLKLFVGDPAVFAAKASGIYTDLQKRIPATSVSGSGMRIHKDANGKVLVREKYTSATVANIIKPSSYFIKDGEVDPVVIDNIYEALLPDVNGNKPITKKMIEEQLQAYKKVNLTDGQAWITLSARIERERGFGTWNESNDEAFKRLEAGTLLADDIKFLLSPIKTTHSELVIKNGVLVQVYNKQSEATLHPWLTKGTELDEVRIAMEEQHTDHVVVVDGRKSGASGVVSLVDENGKIKKAKDIKFNNVYLRNAYLFLQSATVNKGIKPTTIGKQVVKNVVSNVDLDHLYTLNGNKIPGRDLLNLHHTITGKLSDRGAKKLRDKLYYDETLNTIDVDAYYDSLIEEFKGEVSENYIEALEARLPIDSIFGLRTKIQNKSNAMVKKNSVDLKQRGGSLVQMSNFGILGKSFNEIYTSIFWFKDPVEELMVARLKNNIVEGEESKIEYIRSQVLIPEVMIENIPGWRTMTSDELLSKIDPELLYGLGYRIPNQAMSSNDAFEIVGILPKSLGDTIISFSEITTKTGSDFDIDKVFIALYNSKVKYDTDAMFLFLAKEFDLNGKTAKGEKFDKYDSMEMERVFKIAKNEPKTTLTVQQQRLLDRKREVQDDFFLRLEKVKYNPKNETKAGLENYRLDIMYAVLTDPSNYLATVAPLDNPWLADLSNELFGSTEKLIDGQFYTGSYQTKSKLLFSSAKSLVAVVALQMTDHNLSQVDNLYFRGAPIGVGNLTEDGLHTAISQIRDVDGRFISGTLGDYANAIVDAVKDPYITRANINKITAAVAFTLIRSGTSREWVSAFMGQPIMRDFVKATAAQDGKVLEAPREVKLDKKGKPRLGKTLTPYEVTVLKYTEDLEFPVNFEDVPLLDTTDNGSYENLVKQLKSKSTLTQLSVLRTYKEYSEKAKGLSKLVRATRSDVNGAGKTLVSAHLLNNLVDSVLEDDIIGNADVKMDVVTVDNRTVRDDNGYLVMRGDRMIGNFFDNSVSEALRLFAPFFITSSPAFRESIANVAKMQGSKILTDEDLIEVINKELYAYIISSQEARVATLKIASLFYGESSAAKQLVYAKTISPEIKKNTFIKYLKPIIDPTGMTPDFITMNRTKRLNKDAEKLLYLGWEELFAKHKELATTLKHYAYHATGFSRTLGGFHDLLPTTHLIDIKFGDFIARISKSLADGMVLDNGIEQVIRNIASNNSIIPKVPNKLKVSILNTLEDESPEFDKNLIFKVEDNDRLYLGTDAFKNNVHITYITDTEGNLFKLHGYSNDSLPVYVATNKLGYSERGNNIKEYYYGRTANASIIINNNVTLTSDIEEYLLTLSDYSDVFSEQKDYLEASKNEEIVVPPTSTDEEVEENIKKCKGKGRS